MTSSSAPGHRNPPPILPSSGFRTSGWVAINTPRTPFAGRQSPNQLRVQKRNNKSPVRISEKGPSMEPHNTAFPQEDSQNLTPNEREEWDQEFDRVLQGNEDPEDDLPGLSDLPDLARTASKTPLRSSTCPPTPRAQALKSPRPSSKTRGRIHKVVIADSEDEDEDEEGDVIVEMEGHHLRGHSSVPQYNMDVLSRVAAGDPNDDLPSVRSRRRWPEWAETWHEDRLRPRHGHPRYLEAHPNNDWLLWGNNGVQEADVDVCEEVVQDEVMQSIETDYAPGEYEVNKIAGERRGFRGHRFLIQWVGWEDLDWVPARDCFCDDLVAEFRAVQREDLLAAQVDGRETEAYSLKQLIDAARTAAERGDDSNPSLRRQHNNERTPRKMPSGEAVSNEPAAMNLGTSQVESDAEDDDNYLRERGRRSNTAIRSKSRTMSVLRDTPQVPGDDEILWIRSRTVTPGSAESKTIGNRALKMALTSKEHAKTIQGEDGEDEDEMDVRSFHMARIEEAEMERGRKEQPEKIDVQMSKEAESGKTALPHEPQVKEMEKQKRLENTIGNGVYQAKIDKKREQLVETVRKGSRQRQKEEALKSEEENLRRAKKEDIARKAELDAAGRHEREKRESNRAERERRNAKQKRRRASREKSQTMAHDSDQGLEKRSWSPSRSRKNATQERLAAASAVAKEKALRKETLSSSKTKNRKDRSASSMRRSESGDRFRTLREQEREHMAATSSSALRQECSDSMAII